MKDKKLEKAKDRLGQAIIESKKWKVIGRPKVRRQANKPIQFAKLNWDNVD